MKIAYGKSRFEKEWRNSEISWEYFCRKVSTTYRTTETVEEFSKMTKAQQGEIKDIGGFVGGHLKDGKRKSGNVLLRSMLTLDMDYGTQNVIDRLEKAGKHKMCICSTHKHTPYAPRLRLIFPLKRDVTEEEYPAVARKVAQEIDMELFDDATYQPYRLMYWPSTSADGQYVFREIAGEPVDPDYYLSQYNDWHDISSWPVSSREKKAVKTGKNKQENPLGKKGVVGAFCRAYLIREAIEKYLSDIYQPSAQAGRYDYKAGEGSAGLAVYDDVFAYSYHATDPANGKLLNAFDLVRMHRFPDNDPKKSYQKMSAFALADEKVKLLVLAEKQKEADTEYKGDGLDDWKKLLQYDNKKGMTLTNNLHNITLIMANDPNLKAIVFNQLADGMEIKGSVPWKHPAQYWRDADDAQLISYIDSHYGSFSQRNYNIAVTKVADDRSYHPICEYFEALPEWDGIKRVETLLIDYLGAADTPYVRTVTRKQLCAAYLRVYKPGIKYDNMIVLNGGQGIGKSTLISKIGGDWYSDSLNLSDMNDKTAAEKLQGYWILEIGELAGMKKADIDKVKAFISRMDDKYRASFGRRVTPHPRQCVFFGTTNSCDGYLRDFTGNRRFWHVKVTGESKYKPWELDEDAVKQIWSETALIAKAGEKLYLTLELEKYAEKEQREALERDDREGTVQEYLDKLLPEIWDSMDLGKRVRFLEGSLLFLKLCKQFPDLLFFLSMEVLLNYLQGLS